MRTFIIRARKGSTRWERIRSQIGTKEHFEVIAHSVINAFFISSGFRDDVEVYIVLDSSADFPRTIKLSSAEGLSLSGFHEDAVISVVEKALKDAANLAKDGHANLGSGVHVFGYGFDRLLSILLPTRPMYLLDKKGENIRSLNLEPNPVFILSDHLAMPKKSIAGLKRKGLKIISLGQKMLFASQCVVLLNHEMDLNI